ncbi:MAG: beta-lactamase family protein [Microthrixaceae bacterium]|nr:beta-lactamase family protein [Microthrixaceae bacterium]
MRAAQIPAANGVTNAASLARLCAPPSARSTACVRSQRRRSWNAIVPQVEGPDSVLVFPIPFGNGFMTHSDMSPFVGGRSFGHYGAGGSVGFADPDRRLAGGYVMNQMHFGLAGDPRSAALLGVLDKLVR